MLRWMCGITRRDRIRNEEIRGKVGLAPIGDKMRENLLRWFGHVRRRPTEAPVKRCESMEIVRSMRGRGRPKRSWKETIKHDLAYMDLTEDMALNRFDWRRQIHIGDPT